ncbi:MAG: T9SS type A sorting domain-containing protein [Bacteroidales bacterium]|nr:T9SS type A sorting domain-containing protein [Bacteroidales bacterium]
MKKVLLSAAMFAIMLCCNCRAQEMEEIMYSDDSWLSYMTYVDDDTFMAQKSVADENMVWTELHLVKMNDSGEELASTLLWSGDELAEVVWTSPFQHLPNGDYAFFFAKKVGGTATFHKVSIDDDLNLTFSRLNWETDDYNDYDDMTFYPYNTGLVVDRDGGAIITYPPYSQYHINGTESMQFLKFDSEGNLVGQRLMEGLRGQDRHHTLPSPDSTGCRIILRSAGSSYLDCYTLDAELNTVAVKENVEDLSWPYQSCRFAYLRTNQANGKTYSINTVDCPYPPSYISSDIMMSFYDRDNFKQMKYSWGINTPERDNGGVLQTIDFDAENNVYMAGEMDPQGYFMNRNLYIVCFDENLNKFNEIYYKHDYYVYTLLGLAAIPSGGCIISCHKSDLHAGNLGHSIYKIPHEAFLGIDEAHDAGFAVAVAYPNPGGNTLNIRTALTGSHVELYDTDGRLVGRHDITGAVTTISTENLPSGVYVWKMIKDGSEAESGKWVKE